MVFSSILMEEAQENDYARDLRRTRTESARGPSESARSGGSAQEKERLERLAANKDKIVTYVLAAAVGGGNAMLNYFGIGAVPFLGDIIDLGAGATLSGLLMTLEGHPRWKAQVIVWGLTAVELVPAADIISPQAFGVVIALLIAWHSGAKAEEKLEQMRAGETNTLNHDEL